MLNVPSYPSAAQQYADGVRALFAPSSNPVLTERSRLIAAPLIIADHAEKLASASDQLTQAAAAKLRDIDATIRSEASTQLLAKALTDLEVSALLLQAAEDEAAGDDSISKYHLATGSAKHLEEQLRMVLGQDAKSDNLQERGTRAPRDLPSAREELMLTVSDTLLLIKQQAGKTGQTAISGLLGLGMGHVAKAAGIVGMDIVEALGHAEKVAYLYTLFRDFAVRAYESLLALLGPTVAQLASKQVLEWMDDLHDGVLFDNLLDKLYQTKVTEQAIRKMVQQSNADLTKYGQAIDTVDGLSDIYGKQINYVNQLLKGLGFLGGVSSALLPQGKLLLASAYLVLVAYVILAGADFLDAPYVKLLDRVPGVLRTVADTLGAS